MATAKKPQAKTEEPTLQRRGTPHTALPPDSPADIVEATNGANIQLAAQAESDEDMVTVVVPKAFILTRDDHTPVPVAAGVCEMRVSDATHWYCRAMGVQVYDPK